MSTQDSAESGEQPPLEVLAVAEALRRALAAGHGFSGWDDEAVYVGDWRFLKNDPTPRHNQ